MQQRRELQSALLALVLLPALLPGCATNLSEARSARVLRGGEVQVAQINSVNLPTRVVGDLIASGKKTVDVVDQGGTPTDAQRKQLLGGAAAIALSGVGYGTHIDAGFGLGHRLDLSARVGNGTYALSLRRGFDIGRWDAAVGLRAGYGSGSSWIPYFDDINDYAKIADLQRLDAQLLAQVGRDFGAWGKVWFGAKGIVSPLWGSVDATHIGLPEADFDEVLGYVGGYAGVALGYRWVHFVVELSVLYTTGSVELYDYEYDLSGVVIVPTFGLQATF
jgi:hypothetical protein